MASAKGSLGFLLRKEFVRNRWRQRLALPCRRRESGSGSRPCLKEPPKYWASPNSSLSRPKSGLITQAEVRAIASRYGERFSVSRLTFVFVYERVS